MAVKIREDAPYRAFAEKLTKLRCDAGLTRAELGEKVGISGRAIINYENGERIPFGDVCAKLANALDVTMEELLCVENPDLEMSKAEGLEAMRELNGKKAVDRMKELQGEVAELAGGELTTSQLLEFSMEMNKMAIEIQSRINQRFTNKRYHDTADAKAAKAKEEVDRLNNAISDLASEDHPM